MIEARPGTLVSASSWSKFSLNSRLNCSKLGKAGCPWSSKLKFYRCRGLGRSLGFKVGAQNYEQKMQGCINKDLALLLANFSDNSMLFCSLF